MNNFKLKALALSVFGALAFGMAAPAMADSTDDILNALIAKGVLTEEEGALLLKGRENENDKKKKAVSAKFKDGLSFESGDGNFSAAINARIHADYRFFDYNDNKFNTAPAAATTTNSVVSAAGAGPADTFELRRARVGFKAKYKEFYEGEVVADLTGSGATVDVAYLNIAWWKEAQFRFGVFKMPQGLEQLTSSNNIDFMERGYVDQVIAGKEMGAMIHGQPFTGITYALAASNGNGKVAEADIREDGKDVTGRITANFGEIMGYKETVIHTGLSYSQGNTPEGTVGSSGRTEARGATFFRAPVLANTPANFNGIDRDRLGVEAAFAYGPFKVQGEWLQQGNDFSTVTGTTKRNYNLDTEAWYLSALWTISGENYADAYKNGAFGALKPKNDFDPKTFKGGLWEAGIRYSQFDASDFKAAGIAQGSTPADANISTKAAGFSEAKSYTAGLKFLPNANMRYMLNYVKTDFENVIGGTTGGLVINNKRVDDEKAIIMRAQWMF